MRQASQKFTAVGNSGQNQHTGQAVFNQGGMAHQLLQHQLPNQLGNTNQNSSSGRTGMNGNSGRRSIKSIQRGGAQQQVGTNYQSNLHENISPDNSGISGVGVYPNAKSQLNLQMSGSSITNQQNNMVNKYEKNGKSQRNFPSSAMNQHQSPQKYGNHLTNNQSNQGGSMKNSAPHLNKTLTNPPSGQVIRSSGQGQNMNQNHGNSRNMHNMALTTSNVQLQPNMGGASYLQQDKYQNLHKHITDKLQHKGQENAAGADAQQNSTPNLAQQNDQWDQANSQQAQKPQSKQSKIEQKNRLINENQLMKNKNVIEAQKRITRIIRDQQNNNTQMPANEQTVQNPILGDPLQGGGTMNKRSSQQKSRNAAIQQSKSENIINGGQSHKQNQYNTQNQNQNNLSPKNLLVTQQKKMIEHNSNAQYNTMNSAALRNQLQNTNNNSSTESSSAQSQGVNRLRASSGMRNKPGASQNTQNAQNQNSQYNTQKQRSAATNGGTQAQSSGAQREKPSHSQPPASGHHKIERQSPGQAQKQGQKPLQQSKSHNQLVTYRGFIMTMQQQQEYMKMEQDQIDRYVASYHPAKFACKKNGVVSSYSANTHQGIVRNYNEDRVSIILNIIKPKFKQVEEWPRCSFFAVYDGHGGAACADYLRDQLHQLIVRDENFPKNPKVAIENGIAEAEKIFLEWAHQQTRPEEDFVERSGTCAIIVLIVGDTCYVANVGDSRAIMSVDGGEKILLLSKDHKPEDEVETKRVEENGGQIYQNKSYVPDPSPDNATGVQMIIGPHRVFPGRLSVSRTLGDIEAKDPRYGGNPRCVIATPDIKCFKIRSNYDFIILGCDGVFEKQDNKQIINACWDASRCDYENDEVIARNIDSNSLKGGPISIHQKAGLAVDKVLHECVMAKTLDNITAVMIAFENFEKVCQEDNSKVENSAPHAANLMYAERRSLEPVKEEYLESEADTPLQFAEIPKEHSKGTPKVRESSNLRSSEKQLANTQPVNLKSSYHTINADGTASNNLSSTQNISSANGGANRVPSATRQSQSRSQMTSGSNKPKSREGGDRSYQTIQYQNVPPIGNQMNNSMNNTGGSSSNAILKQASNHLQQTSQQPQGVGTPHRGQSGSARRKIVAQQSIQHMKKQMVGGQKEGTPKSRNNQMAYSTAQIPQIGALTNSRVKSSRQSQKGQVNGASGQPRAITPKQGQKMYQSINVGSQKDQRGASQGNSKLSTGHLPMNHRMTNMNNDYLIKNGMGKQGALTQQLGGIVGLTQSNKNIPKKEFRESGQNFNSTQGVKSAHQLQPAQINSNLAAMSSNLHNLTEGPNMLGSSANFNSSGNVKMKFEKTTNLVNLGRPPQTNAGDPSNGRYKKKTQNN